MLIVIHSLIEYRKLLKENLGKVMFWEKGVGNELR